MSIKDGQPNQIDRLSLIGIKRMHVGKICTERIPLDRSLIQSDLLTICTVSVPVVLCPQQRLVSNDFGLRTVSRKR